MIITPEDSRWLNSLANSYRTEILAKKPLNEIAFLAPLLGLLSAGGATTAGTAGAVGAGTAGAVGAGTAGAVGKAGLMATIRSIGGRGLSAAANSLKQNGPAALKNMGQQYTLNRALMGSQNQTNQNNDPNIIRAPSSKNEEIYTKNQKLIETIERILDIDLTTEQINKLIIEINNTLQEDEAGNANFFAKTGYNTLVKQPIKQPLTSTSADKNHKELVAQLKLKGSQGSSQMNDKLLKAIQMLTQKGMK